MDNNSKPAFMPSLSYGTLLGIVLVIYLLILYLVDMQENEWLAVLGYLILVVGLYFFIILFRDKQQNGFISYGKGVSVGVLIGLFAGIVVSIYTYVNIIYIDTSILEPILVEIEESIIKAKPNIEEEELVKTMELMNTTMPYILVFFNVISYTLVSLIFSLLISIFAKREDINIA